MIGARKMASHAGMMGGAFVEQVVLVGYVTLGRIGCDSRFVDQGRIAKGIGVNDGVVSQT